ncbi:MAG: histidine--tRNA ligase [Clostridia bacterium]|nr:histidine--tRNA ligase [Clostridia bacterium]
MLQKTPTKGMRDFLPSEFSIRQQVLNSIIATYEKHGFLQIETPAVENLQLLNSKQGGDNEKLIYKILKRGEKLEEAQNGGELCDLGLRYDLTVPLSRFYSNNRGKLPAVFKAIQTGYVWRADRPQRGRYRQFRQCDMDIIGDGSTLAEIELITATADALYTLGFEDTIVRVNDRKLLSAIANKCGFAQEEHEKVFIALDKLDKIGVNGVLEEISTFNKEKAEVFVSLLMEITASSDPLNKAFEALGDYLDPKTKASLSEILTVCQTSAKANVVFDVKLVRGMNYYTGTIYEIALSGLDIAVGGGGRYDELIGKISGTPAPACGFSIGFERIVLLLTERNAKFNKKEKTALVFAGTNDLADIMKVAQHLRQNTDVCVVKRIKNFAYQVQQLKDEGFTTIYRYENQQLIKVD